jgi:hypothetical protein
MIRIGLPPPLLPRLRLHWRSTHTLFTRQTRSLRESASRTAEVTREGWGHACKSWSSRLSLRAYALARQRARLAAFEAKYEDLVDLLCWAAKDGIHTNRDARYTQLRAWMRVHYRALRPRLNPYWSGSGEDACTDPFEALFLDANVNDVINAAASIENITRTRLALDAYRESLEAAARRP